MSGAAPTFLSNAVLYGINLSHNQLSGPIPPYSLSLLDNLILNNNSLTGTIPSFNLPKLHTLELNNNQLSGAIPNFNMPQLTGLNFNNNLLSGSIPNFNLPYLRSLLLNNNQLTGCIPGAIKINSPDVQFGGDISNNPGLATQSWSDYWNNNAGVCQPPPTASVFSADASSICNGSSTALRVNITGGNSPYTVVYRIGRAPFTVTNYTSGAAIPVSPTANTAYNLVSVTDANSYTGTGNSGAPIINVTQPTTWYLDADRDKYYISSVLSCTSPGPGYSNTGSPAPGDCDDNNAAVHPNATEICDGIDNNCDGQVDEGFPTVNYYRDADGDGYGTPNDVFAAKCSAPAGYVSAGNDCDDNNAAIHPGAIDDCDGIDNDCDGQVDEDGPLVTYYFDVDGDGYGSPDNPVTTRCFAPANLVTNNLDCNDQDANIHPGATEVCNGIDDDCDGQVDEDFPLVTYYFDEDGDGYGSPNAPVQARCGAPLNTVTNNLDCDDQNANVHPGATEICNGIDDNCDGQVDEGFPLVTYYFDIDGDGYGDPNNPVKARCFVPQNTVSNNLDCNDQDANVHPGATEICNGIDDNCDGQVDEGFPLVTYYFDVDGDGYGNPNAPVQARCLAPQNTVSNNLDCNDQDASVHPGATEICGNGIDDNCNGQVDEGFSNTTYYRDADGDGYGNPSVKITAKCTAPAGYVTNKTDCNDNDASVHPGATEICDGIDNNCNGRIDEGFPLITYYKDADGDGYGDPSVGTTGRCTVPAGYVSNRTDCNDNDATVHPGATEICDGIDNNCNGRIDEGFPLITYYKDADGDGYGDKSVVTTSRCTPPTGYVTNRTDCNDNNAAVYPGAPEICDGIDNNCNGQVDEVCNINISITIADNAKNEGSGQSKLNFTVTLDKTPKEAVQVDYTTQNSTATAGSDYVAQTGTLIFAPGVKKQTISITIDGDRVVEPDETFRIVLSNAVKAAIADDEAIGTIINDDGALSRSIVSSSTPIVKQAISVKVSPNPATSVLYVQLSGYKGNVTLQLRSLEGKVLKEEKLYAGSSKSPQQKINVASLASGVYFLTAIDEKGNMQSEKVIIAH